MNTIEFLSYLRNLEVKLSVDGERLRCNAPKGVLTPDLQAELAERKAEILTFLQNANLAKGSTLLPMQPVPRDGDLPLSFAQQRLWFLDQLESGSSTYNMATRYRLTGSLNVAALEQSLREIERRHEVLRTTFAPVKGEPVQVISPETTLTLAIADLRELPETERETEVQLRFSEEARQPFDLARGPLLRVKLLCLTEEEHILLLTIHHIAFDGWSFDVFFRELVALYEAFSSGKPSPLPEQPIQYADFAHWQRQWLQGQELESQLNYWKQQLGSSPPVLELPTDRPRPPVQTFSGSKQVQVLSKNLTEELKALSQRSGVTFFMTLLAAFQTLLYRYSGQEDIIVGSPIAGRNQVETEGLIGFFVNTLVLHTELSNNLSFRELLERVRKVTLGAYAHQDLPFEKLVEELQPERSLSYNPLFQVMFILQNAPMHSLDLPGLILTPIEGTYNKTAKFDLTLSMEETEQGLRGSWEYNTDLFDDATITRMLGHFQTLLEGIVANPDRRLSDLPLLTAAERHQLLVEWNNTQTDYPQESLVHQLLEAEVDRTPDAVAVVFEDEQLTYRELNSRANQLAHYLQALGVGPEVLVGICVERSLEMVVGLLGILKAGGAYVPLDSAYPKERLAYMLSDSQVSVLLTQEKLLAGLPEHQARAICLDKDWGVISTESEENPVSDVKSENLAYVIYTSGSTGKPKGVAMRHLPLANLILWQLKNTTVSSGARTLQFAPVSFDVSFQEIFSTWCSGGTLVLISEEVRRDTAALIRLLNEKAVARLFLPFVALQQLAEVADGSGAMPTSLREIITAGEQLQITLPITNLFKTLKSCTLHNHYGPSESHVVTAFTLQDSVSSWSALPAIGRPIANTQIYLLNQSLQPVPIGVPGELYIGGDCLARCYLNRPDLTAQKFIPDPFSNEPGACLYKTGDLARYLPDGNIEYMGRIDNQVKIRGFRIEIGEIEAVLAQHPAAKESVVVAREDRPGNKRLVAYFVPNHEQVPTRSELRGFLKEKMPEYMVPSVFVILDALPLTPSGKVDRRALPAPDQAGQDHEESFVAPQDELELLLTKIWEKVLGIKSIGVRDNFFALGGHSLLAVRLLTEIEKVFGKNLPLVTFFEAQTVEQLAYVLRQQEWSAPWRSLVVIQRGNSTKPPLFLMHEIWGNVFFYRELVRNLDPEQPCYGLQARGLDDKQPPHTLIEEMAADYIKEIQTVQPEGPYFIGGFSFGGLLAFEVARQLHAQGEKIALLAILDRDAPGYVELTSDAGNAAPETALGRFLSKWCNFSKLSLRDKRAYLRVRLEWHFKAGIVSVFYRNYIRYIKRSPQDLRMFDVLAANYQAHDSYSPPVYPGRLSLFRTIQQDAESDFDDYGWGKLAAGGVEIYEIPAVHWNLMQEPSVQLLAKQLTACLNKVQVTNSKANSR